MLHLLKSSEQLKETFQALRDQWALKALVPDKDYILMHKQMDANLNPHNDNYLNKKPRRTESEIISDYSYSFADAVLTQQYGASYRNWLQEASYTEVWGTVCRKT